jgi:hypothetical protein
LASLLVKTLAKPLSKRIKHEFSRYSLTQSFLIGLGQGSHQITSRMTIWSAGYRVRRITPLEEDKALSTGAEFVGEGFILLVSGGLVVWEYNRGNEKSRVKEEKIRQTATEERNALQAKLKSLDVRVHALEDAAVAAKEQERKDESLLSTRILGSRQPKQTYQAPNPSEIVPIDEDDKANNSQEQIAATPAAETSREEESPSTTPVSSSGWWNWRPW